MGNIGEENYTLQLLSTEPSRIGQKFFYCDEFGDFLQKTPGSGLFISIAGKRQYLTLPKH